MATFRLPKMINEAMQSQSELSASRTSARSEKLIFLKARSCSSLIACGLAAVIASACAVTPTSPVEQETSGLRFAFGGDLAGQNVCRDLALGFPIFGHIKKKQPDFFIALGDMIYADDVCEATGRYGNAQVPRNIGVATTDEEFARHWQYVREDPGFTSLLKDVPYYAVWDDHEVRNDFGPASANKEIIAASRSAFAAVHGTNDGALYYRQGFGELLEVFFLDTRSYRDANAAPDLPEKPKSMLGNQQKSWLIENVSNSGATWKIIVTSVPLSIPTGWPPEGARDGWADFDSDSGFEQELLEILAAFANNDVGNLVFVTADVHFATGFRYRPFTRHPEFSFHEFVVGPLNAGLFPNLDFDKTLNPERLFFYGPDPEATELSYAEALRWFNFGLIKISSAGQLDFELVDGLGESRYQQAIMPR